MSQCVPSWEVDENPIPSRLTLRSNSNSTVPAISMLDYEVAELTWENGQLAMHGLGLPRAAIPGKCAPPTTTTTTPTATTTATPKSAWGDSKPRATGTLESVVNQAGKWQPPTPPPYGSDAGHMEELVTWLDHNNRVGVAATMVDALVPCSNPRAGTAAEDHNGGKGYGKSRVMESAKGGSARVGSCSGPFPGRRGGGEKVAARGVGSDWSGRDQSACGSAGSQHVTLDTCERVGFTSTTSFGSHDDYTSSGKPGTRTAATGDENDSACHSRPQREGGDEEKKKGNGKSNSVSTKRSRAAAIHNQSERKRRDKINQRMKTLQKLVPSSSKTDKASMLDEVIDYLKQLQAQVQMMNRMNMQPMMLPMAMQQQLQMSMMAPMNMGMGMGMGMLDMNSMGRPAMAGLRPVLHPTAFMPGMSSWDGGSGADRLQSAMTDPMSVFLACQSQQQPMNMDAYSRMAALYHQLQQKPPGSGSSN